MIGTITRRCALAVFTIGAVVAAPPDPGRVVVVDTPAPGAVPDAAVAPDGSVHLVWVSGDDVFHATTRDAGRTLSAPLRVNDSAGSSHPPNTHRGPEVAVDSAGTVHVIWFRNGYQQKLPRDQWGVDYAQLKPGAAAFEPARNLSRRPSEGFSLAVGDNREVAVCFLAEGVWTVTSADGGATFRPPEQVPDCRPCPCCATRAAFDARGRLHLFLRLDLGAGDSNLRDMYLLTRGGDNRWRQSLISDRPWPIPTCPMAGASCERVGDSFLLAWETRNDLSFMRFTPGADPAKPRPGPVATLPAAGGKYPTAAAAPDGTVCLSWKRDNHLEWRLFDPAGRPRGPAQSRPATNALRHAAVALPDGRFLLVN
jgi:hypothetical protein